MDAARGELRHDFLPYVRRCLDVAEAPPGRVEPMSEKPRESAQRPPRQVGVETAGNGVHANGLERKMDLRLESFGPVAQKGELELGKMDGRGHAIDEARRPAQPFPRVLRGEG